MHSLSTLPYPIAELHRQCLTSVLQRFKMTTTGYWHEYGQEDYGVRAPKQQKSAPKYGVARKPRHLLVSKDMGAKMQFYEMRWE